ncbi:FK506-binding protein 15 isoform X3 [Trichomycterus rosablanca]|uniref:FK506-binding protein 15 isoform X3 n=1 Tax=Trichomycterus rosablanca TaxID=2290929 RepID=UPI002F354C47
MFATDDEDGDFLSPTGGAKLASLFGLDQATSKGNESFQYTAPKQPRKSSGNPGPAAQKPAPPGSPAVLLATAVQAYRYVNGQYMKQGKLGAAVLGNHANKEYKLLLYASQQKQVTAARIHSAFIFTVQPNNYCTFYDDQRQNWSLMFESEKAATDFCKEVCLAKANCSSLEVLVTQDLILGEGQGVENGDLLEVVYTGWLLQNHTIGQMFDSNINKDKLLRLKLGAGKVIKGWEEGMLNMCKGERRLLVIPPALAYGSEGVQGRIPADSTLVFEAEIRRVKFAKDASSEKSAVGSRDSAVPSPAPSVESLGPELTTSVTSKPSEPPLRAKSNSLSEQLANPDATKAKLISRMAKMGQPMLPFLAGTASSPSQAESSDSELEDPSVSRRKEGPPPSPQPVPFSSGPSVSQQATALMPVSVTTASSQPLVPAPVHGFQPYSYTQSTAASSYLQPVGQMYPTQTVPYQGSGDVTSFLMTEARQHNTEIRLAVSKVGDKVDQLASKVEELHKQGGLPLGLSNVSMETGMIMQSIQRIIQENECLKKEVFEKSLRIEEQNRKIGELINQNQRYMEQSHLLMEQRNDSLKNSSEQNQARILQAEQEKVRLTEELASSTARVSELQLELSAQHQKSAGLQSSLNTAVQEGQQHFAKLAAMENQLQELKEAAEQTQVQYRTEKQKRKEVELKLSNLDEELQDLRSEKESVERTLVDRKRKWQAERQRCDEELEEVRKASQIELDNLRSQLRKARTNTDHAATELMVQLQTDMEHEWKAKCEQAVAKAREQQNREITELTEQKDSLQLRVNQLQDKFSALKQSREEEEQRFLQQQDQGEELQALKNKCTSLEQTVELLKQQGEKQSLELKKRLTEQQEPTDTAGEVKRVMNGVFHSLRGEFDLHETYTGSVVLSVLVNTIKNVTLQLLSKSELPSTQRNEKKENKDEAEEETKSEAPAEKQENPSTELHVNGKKEEEEEQEEKQEDEEEGEEGKQQAMEVRSEAPDILEDKAEERKEPEVEEQTAEQESEQSNEEVKENVSAGSGQEAPEGPPEDVSEITEKSLHSDITTPLQTQNEVITEEEVSADPLGQVSAEDEVKENNKSVSDQLDESDLEETMAIGPPKNPPPPPPNPLQEDGTETPAQLSSSSQRVEEENSEEPFFQSPTPAKPKPQPSKEEEEEEEELSLKGRPPPASLFGEDSDDDLDWMN